MRRLRRAHTFRNSSQAVKSTAPVAAVSITATATSDVVCIILPSPRQVHTYIATPGDPLVESLFKIKIASKTSHARWLSWVSTSSFSSIASGRGECRDGHITTKPTHSYNSAHHTYIHIEHARSSTAPARLAANRITPAVDHRSTFYNTQISNQVS